MSTTRLTGEWQLYFAGIEPGPEKLAPIPSFSATLAVAAANRAGIEAKLKLAGEEVLVKGRIRPGTPSVISLDECDNDGKQVDDGVEAILYVPPWRPNIDYDFDILCGTAVIGANSGLTASDNRERVLTVTGLQAFE
ncbi:hypothetical protein [Croceicoccus marinus]|jgi:hypothetical protein|uniref:Uncharacterized protein n=1 Tax=Croceicoccus marinus TaxID=450378 RepID=A0A7G6VZI4_9SPHN|nr:hypothetical protein [Croceicoccus marinus]QNE07149.1 hypothetical protein H4O24_19235 [Croceicoccus marinus]